jgi:NDP-sugar pyrophosphorylase family protein
MTKSKISITISETVLQDIDNIIDNIYIRNRSQAIEYLVSNSLGENKTAVIMLGGNEDNLRISKDEFRPTSKIGNRTIIELALKKLRENNFRTIFIVARHLVLTKLFDLLKDGTEYGVKINYIEEKISHGTADSLRLLKGKISSKFIAVYGDIIFSKINIDGLWNDHLKHNSVATIMLTTSSKPYEKGTVKVEGNKVLEFMQKPKKSDIYLVFSPIFVSDTAIFDYSGHSLEFDVFPLLAEKDLLNGHLSSEKEVHIHTKKDLEKVNASAR